MTYTNGTMTLPKNAVAMDQEEMRYVEGGEFVSKGTCSAVFKAISISPGAFIGMATYAAVVTKLLNKVKVMGGFIGWAIGTAISFATGCLIKLGLALAGGALHKGVNITFSWKPWDFGISTKVKY